jgi:hypothetical protein
MLLAAPKERCSKGSLASDGAFLRGNTWLAGGLNPSENISQLG